MKYKYSIIIPCYNCEKFISKCLDSLLNQTYSNFEVILVDDGSTDNTNNILKKYSKIDNRFIVYRQENGGVSSARNLGLSLACGDYITFIDSDDFIELNTIEIVNSHLSKNDVDILKYNYYIEYGRFKRKYRFFSPINSIVGKDEFKIKICPFVISTNDFGNCWNCFIKKEIISDIKFDTNLKFAEDRKFVVEAFSKSNNIIFISDLLYHYIINPSSAMNNMNSEKMKKRLIDAIYSNYSSSKLLFDKFLYNSNDFFDSLTNDLNEYVIKLANYTSYKKYLLSLDNIITKNGLCDVLLSVNFNYEYLYTINNYKKFKIKFYIYNIKSFIKKIIWGIK